MEKRLTLKRTVRTKVAKRLIPDPNESRPIRLWFRLQPNGKVTCAHYVDETRIDVVKPFEPSMWRRVIMDIRAYMTNLGWPRKEVKIFFDERNPQIEMICAALLDQCILPEQPKYTTKRPPKQKI